MGKGHMGEGAWYSSLVTAQGLGCMIDVDYIHILIVMALFPPFPTSSMKALCILGSSRPPMNIDTPK